MSYFLTDFLQYFSAIELYRLKLTCKQFNQAIDDDLLSQAVKNAIMQRLKRDIDDFVQFEEFFNSTNAFISGSFIIQNILGEYYDNSDIDIYIPIKNDEEKMKMNYNFTNFRLFDDRNFYNTFDSGELKICRVVDYIHNNDTSHDPVPILQKLDDFS